MKKYIWRGINIEGQNKRGVLIAASQEHLKDLLLERGVALLNSKVSKSISLNKFLHVKIKIGAKEKVFFFSQLAVLINSGVDILKSLHLLFRLIKSNKLKKITKILINDVASGKSFSDSLQKHSSFFNNFMVQAIKAGEGSGRFGEVLQNLSNYLNDRIDLQKRLKHAVLLPGITLSFAILIMFGVFVFVIPQFEALFISMEQPLPDSTILVIRMSRFFRSQSMFFYGLSFLGLILIARMGLAFDCAKKLKDKIILNFWFLGKILLLSDIISFLQNMVMFLKSGVQLRTALDLSAQTVKNRHIKEKIFLLSSYVSQGKSLEESLMFVGNKYFPDNLVAVVSIGEQAGNLDLMLERATKFFQEELKSKLQFVLVVLQPALMVVIGALIVFLMLSIYLPIFNVASLV
jgi:type IV pilus assembly protein PilC